ncbi:hypothetical protein BHM03_00061322 [Ensete ventricosum]|nr:hypothetical protein BHM03_00061322 [Ensete ventricosum]
MDPTTPYDRGMPRVVAHLPFSDNAQLVTLRSGVPRKCRGAEIVPTRTLFIVCFRPCKGQGGYYLTTRSGFWAARRRGDQPWPAPMQCRPATAKALARGRLAAARASPQGRLTPLAGAAARRGGACGHGWLRPAREHSRLQCDARKGGQLEGARKGLPPAASPVASGGGDAGRKGGYPLAGWLPAGKGNRRLRRGSPRIQNFKIALTILKILSIS